MMLIREENFKNLHRAHVIIKDSKFATQIAQSMQIDSIFEDSITGEELKEKMDSIEVDDSINAIFAVV